jgi:S1-C subfamily serine protease
MRLLATLCFILLSSSVIADELDTKLKQILYPIVRVTMGNSGGSGTIVYSEDREKSGEFQTFIFTNHHVVDAAIHVEKIWDSLDKSYKYVENNDLVNIEIFSYANGGRTVTRNPVKAEIIAYTEDEDIALLRLKYPFEVKHAVQILPPDKKLRLFQKVYNAGCPLLVDPIFTTGEITDLEVLIDKKVYIGCSADIIWGNSGGGTFVKFDDRYYLVGIPSRVNVAGYQAVTYMGYFISPERLTKFVKVQKLDFLLDKSKTPTEAYKARENLKNPKKEENL